jgi:hypothetical protein
VAGTLAVGTRVLGDLALGQIFLLPFLPLLFVFTILHFAEELALCVTAARALGMATATLTAITGMIVAKRVPKMAVTRLEGIIKYLPSGWVGRTLPCAPGSVH